MRDEDLIVLLRNEAAASLALAWPRVGAVPGMSESDLVRAWSRVSGVALFETRRLAPVLLGAKICLDGGAIDPRAQAVAGNLVALEVQHLAEDVRKRRETRPPPR